MLLSLHANGLHWQHSNMDNKEKKLDILIVISLAFLNLVYLWTGPIIINWFIVYTWNKQSTLTAWYWQGICRGVTNQLKIQIFGFKATIQWSNWERRFWFSSFFIIGAINLKFMFNIRKVTRSSRVNGAINRKRIWKMNSLIQITILHNKQVWINQLQCVVPQTQILQWVEHNAY